MIEADSTNIGLIQPFVEGIFSDLTGRVNGHIRLYGDFKHLDWKESTCQYRYQD